MKNLKIKISSVAIILVNFISHAQVTTPANTGSNTDYVGWQANQLFDVKVEHKGAYDIDFSTNGTQRATILANGNVGIGTTTPAHLLEVDGGDISIADYNQGLRIGGSPGVTPSIPSAVVLSLWGCTSCLYVGYDAGGANTTGGANTFIGSAAGQATTTGQANTFVGNGAGVSNVSGNSNVAVGTVAASIGSTGNNNTSVGVEAARDLNGGNENVALGSRAALNITSGSNNTSLGWQAGLANTTGSRNTFTGSLASAIAGNLTNATAIGANARVDASNALILGSVNNINGATATVRVGIGLTNPAHRLDVGDGDVNVNSADRAYMIGGQRMLWHNNDISNIYVGFFAGNVDNGFENTFVGSLAGAANTTGYFNTFTGQGAGNFNTTGFNNTFIGQAAGGLNTTGIQNTCLGSGAGLVNTTGSNNVFVGIAADAGQNNLTNATAIGAFAEVGASNSLVLGSVQGFNGAGSTVNVGIGTTTPDARLEVDNINPGSGLRLTRLTAGSTPSPSNGVALSVDNDGDVILVPSSIAGTGITACTAGTTNYLTKWCATTNQLQNSIIFDNGTNVGIGSTAPAYPLHVNGTIAATQFLVVDKTQTKDLLALVTNLQKEVEELKQKVVAATNN